MFETLNHFQIWQHVKSQQSHGYAVKQGKRRNKNDLLKFKPCLSIYSEIPILYHRWQIMYMFLQINATYSFNILLQYIPSKLSSQVASSVTRRTESRDMTTEMMTTEIC